MRSRADFYVFFEIFRDFRYRSGLEWRAHSLPASYIITADHVECQKPRPEDMSCPPLPRLYGKGLTENQFVTGYRLKYGVLMSPSPFAKEHGVRAPADAWPRDLASRRAVAVRSATVKTACKKLFPVKRSMFLQFADCSAHECPSVL